MTGATTWRSQSSVGSFSRLSPPREPSPPPQPFPSPQWWWWRWRWRWPSPAPHLSPQLPFFLQLSPSLTLLPHILPILICLNQILICLLELLPCVFTNYHRPPRSFSSSLHFLTNPVQWQSFFYLLLFFTWLNKTSRNNPIFLSFWQVLYESYKNGFNYFVCKIQKWISPSYKRPKVQGPLKLFVNL